MGGWTCSVTDLVIRFIVALDVRLGIATEKGIPWKLPGDAAYFRQQTSTGLVVMGRATYAEFSAPLHERTNYVLTSKAEPLRDGFTPIGGLDQVTTGHPDDDIWVIGGGAVFASTMAQANELYLTQVEADFQCTKFFPAYDDQFTRFDQSETHEEGGVSYRFEKWRRNRAA
jgi:dihydrofolate reductase